MITILGIAMENRNKLYRQIGETLHLGQVLELQMRVLVSILNDNFGSDLNQDGLILYEDKKTLGFLIKELQKYSSLDEDGGKILKSALESRNYIAHDFFNKNVNAFSDDQEFARVTEKLTKDSKLIAEATAMITAFVNGFCEALQINIEQILVKQT